MNILVTGSNGFIGRNLIAWLQRLPDVRVSESVQGHTAADLAVRLAAADLIYHLAGVNRPQSVEEFRTGNVDLTAQMCELLLQGGRATPIVLSSSIQAELDNPYGVSKREAEQVLADYAAASGAPVTIFRLSNVFGKWCRPNYNSVVATFCYNIARDLPITISDPGRELELLHVDDVVRCFLEEVQGPKSKVEGQGSKVEGRESKVEGRGAKVEGQGSGAATYRQAGPSHKVTLGRLAELIRSFRESRRSLVTPDFSDPFTYKLYGTFLSYLEPDDFAYDLTQRTDARGTLAEFVKSPPFGQIFVSRTGPGITRGNHFHHTKTEKFLVLEGEAVIRFRRVQSEGEGRKVEGRRSEVEGRRSEVEGLKVEGRRSDELESGGDVIEYRVSGRDFRVVDIPPGYTHSIENVGQGELMTLFWASEVFDPERPDTYFEEV